MKSKIKKGEIKKVGKFSVFTKSHKSSPGDGSHGKGVRGGGSPDRICF